MFLDMNGYRVFCQNVYKYIIPHIHCISFASLPLHECSSLLSCLLAHLGVSVVCFSLVSQPLSWCPICKQWWIINCLALPQETPQVCIFQQKLQQALICVSLLARPVLEPKSKFNVIAVAKALKRPCSLNIHLIDSNLFLRLLVILCYLLCK